MREIQMTCIICPVGCTLKVTLDENERFISVKGNRCPKGEIYAKDEITDPKRVLTSSVLVINGVSPLVSVKTDRAIPKKLINDVMKIVRSTRVKAPINIEDVIVENVLGTGANLIATKSVNASNSESNP